jgi:hypothetical protein
VRPWLVQQVASDLIGPRGGLFESLGRDRRPDLEYSIGILAPPEERQLESDLSQDQLEDEKSGEEDTGSSKAQEPVAFSPGLDPKSYPPSLGLSFTCRSESETPRFDIAISYARYNSSEQGYSREPRACVLPVEEIRSSLAASGKAFRGSVYLRTGPLEEPGSRTLEACAKGPVSESRVSLVMRPSSGDLWTVSIFLTTDLEMPDGPFDLEARCEAKIFQPEIRIRMRDGTEASEEFGPKTVAGEELTEEAIDRELYRGRGQVARGHLCSAMWKEHDPQVISDEDTARISAEMEKFGQSFSLAPPFHWVDSTHPAFASDLEGFYPPDIRTEYMPLLNLPAPEMNPGEDSIPAIGASQLAEAVSGGEIRRILEPLLDWYSGWIEDSFDSEGNPMHGELKARAETSLSRMKKGVEMLARDDQARLAFNMANKAIHLSNHWQSDGKWDFVWRKFQIAFVLLAIESTSRRGSPDRRQLDLLWVATGGGKTEAYLLLMAYLLCLRRLRPGLDSGVEETHWQGVNVITRYTLRLLTIQQFRRTLGVITAMEWLRAQNEESGWAPEGIQLEANPWGIQPFGIGIWVGGAVTPNNLGKVTKRGKTNRIGIIKGFNDRYFNPGFMDALHGLEAGDALSDAMAKLAAEPAQVIFCPCCRATLSFPRASDDSPSENDSTIHWVIQSRDHPSSTVERMLRDPDLSEIVRSADLVDHDNGHYTLSIDVTMESGVHERSVEKLWKDILSLSRNSFEYSCARPSRPGYFYISKEVRGGNFQYTDFVIHCPDPQCPLNQTEWEGRLPAGRAEGKKTQRDRPEPRPEGFQIEIPGPWRKDSNPYLSRGIPIPACTVDEQVYSRLPSVVISTVDKFARLPFEPRAGGMFGNVDHHHDVHGFIRAGAKGKNPSDLKDENCRIVPLPGGLASPDLIIQDELHLIEGPLGSMVGFYETVVEALIKEGLPPDTAPKYVASTATIRSADPQVQCLFNRKVTLFPPKGPTWSDRGMIREVVRRPLPNRPQRPRVPARSVRQRSPRIREARRHGQVLDSGRVLQRGQGACRCARPDGPGRLGGTAAPLPQRRDSISPPHRQPAGALEQARVDRTPDDLRPPREPEEGRSRRGRRASDHGDVRHRRRRRPPQSDGGGRAAQDHGPVHPSDRQGGTW